MKFLPLIWAGLWRKPLRTVLTSLALVVAFVQFGLLQGINEGFNALIASARDDVLYVSPRYGIPLPLGYKAQIAQMPGVKSVIAGQVVNGQVNGDPKKQLVVAFTEEGFFDLYRWLDLAPAARAEWRNTRSAVVVGKVTADRFGLRAGDRINLKSIPKKSGGNDWQLDIVAVLDRNDVSGASVTIGNVAYLNDERATGVDLMDQMMVFMTDPKLSAATARAIDDLFLSSAAPTRTIVDQDGAEQKYEDDSTHTMVTAIVLATFFALLLMTTNSMMQSFRERIPELGTLKALGFGDRHVLAIVLVESLLQCAGGALIGMAIARLLLPYAKTIEAMQRLGFMNVSWSLVLSGFAIACLIAFASAGLPAWRAARLSVVEALARR